LQCECYSAKQVRVKQRLGSRRRLVDFLSQKSRDLFRVLHITGGKQIAEAFKGGIRQRCHDPSMLLPEMLAKLSFLNVRALAPVWQENPALWTSGCWTGWREPESPTAEGI